jgi:hypothetical protein
MSDQQKTHYKSFFNSTFLNDGDFDTERDTVCVVSKVIQVEDETRDGKQVFNAIMLEGYSKPMKAPNEVLKALKKALGSPFVEDWQGKHISIYILKGLRAFGAVHDVPRVRPVAPRINIDIEPAKAQLNACKTVDALRDAFKTLAPEIRKHPQIVKLGKELSEGLA